MEAVRSVCARIELRRPLGGRRVELAKIRLCKSLAVDEVHIGKIAIEINVCRSRRIVHRSPKVRVSRIDKRVYVLTRISRTRERRYLIPIDKQFHAIGSR